jgi:hypothetical protein
MEREFLAAGAVDIEDGSAGKARVAFVQTQWLPVLTKCFQKTQGLFSGEPDHAHFCDHDRPAENRADREGEENDFAGNGCVFESEKEPAAREEFREQDRGQVELINNAFRKKRKSAVAISATHAHSYAGILFGNVGRNFATTTNAIPIASRKKEKNCPRVKAPISGASGSRKFSQTIRKIA